MTTSIEAQANFKLTKRIKSLSPNVVKSFNKDDSYDAFKEFRWGWRDGLPECPKCKHEKHYEIKRSTGMISLGCKKCGHRYSVTSGSVLSNAKLPHKAYLSCLSNRLHLPLNITELSERVGVSYRTAWSLTKKLNLYSGSITIQKVSDSRWPYLTGRESDEDVRILNKVSKVLPNAMPEQVRGDVGQQLVVGLLMGDFDETKLAEQVRQYTRLHYKNSEAKWGDVSLSQPKPSGQLWDDCTASPAGSVQGDWPEQELSLGDSFYDGMKIVRADPTYTEPERSVDIDLLISEYENSRNIERICAENNWAQDEVGVYLQTLFPNG